MPGAAEEHLELGVERAFLELGDDDPVDPGGQLLERVLEQVMGHRPGALHPLEGVDDGRRLRLADEDREVAPAGGLFAQENDRLVARNLDSYAHERKTDHRPASGGREATLAVPP